MSSKPFKTLYASEEGQPKPLLTIGNTTIHTATHERSEEILSEFIPDFAAIHDHDDYFILEIRSGDSEKQGAFINYFNETQASQISDYHIRQKELILYPNPSNRAVGFVIGQFIQWNTRVYNDGVYTTLVIFSNEPSRNFILNNDMQLSFSEGQLGMDDNQSLTAEELCAIDHLMARQQGPDWFISAEEAKSSRPEEDVLREVAQALGESDVLNINELKITKGFADSKKALDDLIGMDNIKEEIRALEARLSYIKNMEARGFFFEEPISLHMCFLGAPGTGKTTVARILTGILSDYKYIKKNKCIELSARQLVGAYVGQTGDRTAKICRAAKGGILFLDEAYTLVPPDNTSGNDFSYEAVAQLLKEMEDNRGDLIVILAGYNKDMQKLLDLNEGLRSRINRHITFENYSLNDAVEIFMTMLRKEHYRIDRAALEKLWLLVKKCHLAQKFSNGRFVRNLFERIYEQHAYRVYTQPGINPDLITVEDLDDQDVCKPIISSVR